MGPGSRAGPRKDLITPHNPEIDIHATSDKQIRMKKKKEAVGKAADRH